MAINPLSADLDTEQVLVIPELEVDMNMIQKLDDEPNDVGGLTAAQLKAEFDKAGNAIKQYINGELLPSISETVVEAAVRAEAEAGRVQAEAERVTAEEARAAAEAARATAENNRRAAEYSRDDAERTRKTEESNRKVWEQGRVQDERARATAEEARAKAEQARAEAEESRSIAEEFREKSAQNRTVAEMQRAQAEQLRISAETERAEAEEARAAAERARADEDKGIVAQATAAKDAIENMEVSAVGLSVGQEPKVEKTVSDGVVNLKFSLPAGPVGPEGPQAAIPLVGPAALVEELLPGGILFIVDDGDPDDYAVSLDMVLEEGDKAYRAEGNILSTLLTPGRVRMLNLRKDQGGSLYTEEDMTELANTIKAMCTDAQGAGGSYVLDGKTVLSQRQVQWYLLHKELVSHSDTYNEDWTWTARDPETELIAMRQQMEELSAQLAELRAAVGEANDTLAEVLGENAEEKALEES